MMAAMFLRVWSGVPHRRQSVVHWRQGQGRPAEHIRPPNVDDSESLGSSDLSEQPLGASNKTLVGIEAVMTPSRGDERD